MSQQSILKSIQSAKKNIVIVPEWPNYMQHSQRFNKSNPVAKSISPEGRRIYVNQKYGISIDNPLSNPYTTVFSQSKGILGECSIPHMKCSEAGLAVSNEVHRSYYLNGQPKIFANTIKNGITREINSRSISRERSRERPLDGKSKREQFQFSKPKLTQVQSSRKFKTRKLVSDKSDGGHRSLIHLQVLSQIDTISQMRNEIMKSALIANKANFETERLVYLNYQSQKQRLSDRNKTVLEKSASLSTLRQKKLRKLNQGEFQKLISSRENKKTVSLKKNILDLDITQQVNFKTESPYEISIFDQSRRLSRLQYQNEPVINIQPQKKLRPQTSTNPRSFTSQVGVKVQIDQINQFSSQKSQNTKASTSKYGTKELTSKYRVSIDI